MKPRKKGKKWEISYRIPGYKNTFNERFDSKEEAMLRRAEVELAKANGTITPPVKKDVPVLRTMSELLDEFISSYGTTHWGDSYLTLAKHRSDHYIKPFIGNYLVRDVTAGLLEKYYADLLTAPAVQMKGHKEQGTVSFHVMEKCHSLIRSALNMAVRWGYINNNPAAFASLPKRPRKKTRDVWEPDVAFHAIDVCKDPNLKICMQLSLACSLRIGEILGLQWDNVFIDKESITRNNSYLEIRQELKRCSKESLQQLDEKNRSDVFFTFPSLSPNAKSVLVLKEPKTETSIRRVYIPDSIAVALMELKAKQCFRKKQCHGLYQEYNLVIAHNDGNPVELRSIDKALKKLIKEYNLPPVVFHSLRHLSASLKLQYSGGDIKAVQGDTGHSQARMVTQVYSHTFVENRKRMANLMEENFFSANTETEKNPDDQTDEIVELLNEKPELRDLILALSRKSTA